MKIPGIKSRSLFVRIALWALLALAILFIGGFLYVRSWLNSYLNSDAFRQLLGRLTSQQLDARCEYEPFHFSLTAINADAFKAQGTAKAAFSTLELDKIHTAIHLAALWNRSLQIDEVKVDRLQVSLGHTGAPPVPESEIGVTASPTPAPASGSSRFAWISPKLDLRKVIVKDADVLWGEKTPQVGSVNGSTVTVTPDADNAWDATIRSGTISQKGGPDLLLDHINVRYRDPIVTIPEGLLKFPPGGNIALSGAVNTEKDINVLIKVNDIPLKPFLPPDLQSKLKGTVFADVKVNGAMPMQILPEVSGSGKLDSGYIEGIPALDFIAKFTRSPQFRRIKLDQASAEFTYIGQKVTVSNLVIESRGLIDVQGNFVINHSDINGTFQIGVPHDLVKWLPGLEAKVFTVARGNYRWTTMHLSGPLSSPHDDLKPRIELALAMSAVDVVAGAVKDVPKVPQAQKKMLDGIMKPLLKSQ